MQRSNMEIEFKTAITKDKYNELLKLFDLEENIFLQTNFYFDTNELDLNKRHTVLRIRQKGERYKVTLKKQEGKGAFEKHVFISKEQALDMIENGFNTNDFFDNENDLVTFKASLDNYRVSTPYLDGVLFLDRCFYHDITDYEIEYEVADYDEGLNNFNNLLKEHDVLFIETKRKSERALKTK